MYSFSVSYDIWFWQFSDFQCFLKQLIHREVSNYPRSIYHLNTRQQSLVGGSSKAVKALPEFLLTQYEQNSQPGLRPGLAGKDNLSTDFYLALHVHVSCIVLFDFS